MLTVLFAALIVLGCTPGVASASACPGANPCPWTAQSAFGSEGANYMISDGSVAVDASGNEYVSEFYNSRVEKFNASGQLVWIVGAGNASGAAGSGNDQFNGPFGVRLNPAGTVLYVADRYNNRIDELSTTDGSFLGSFGTGGTGAGQLNQPIGLGVDPVNGTVYVADFANNRVDAFTAAGVFEAAFGWNVVSNANAFQVCTASCQAGASGTGGGEFTNPIGVVVDASHNVYVSEYAGNRVQAFATSPTPPPSWILEAISSVPLNQPYGMVIDHAGNLLVADAGDNRIVELTTTLMFVSTFGWGVADGASNFETCTTSCGAGSVGLGTGQFHYPEDVAVDPSGNIYVADDGNSRVDRFTISPVTPSSTIGAPGFDNFANPANDQLRLNQEDRMVLTPGGDVWLSDSSNDRLVEVDPGTGQIVARAGAFGGEGDSYLQFGCTLTGDGGAGQLCQPFEVSLNAAGDLWVADAGYNRIDEFSPSGAFMRAIGWGVSDGQAQLETCAAPGPCERGLSGNGFGEFNGAQGVAVDSAGDIIVADTYGCRVQELSAAGAFIRAWGAGDGTDVCGSGPGAFSQPVDVAIDPSGNIWVVDYANSNVQEFSSTGAYIKTVGGPGTTGGTFDGPQQVSFDPAGDLLVADRLNSRVQLIDPLDGSFAYAWGYPPAGATPAAGEIEYTGGAIAVPGGKVAVTDQGYGDVQVFSFPNPGVSAPSAAPAAVKATLSATVDPGGGVVPYRFDWGTTSAYGNSTPIAVTGPSTSAQTVSATITGLQTGTTYHWRLVASGPGASAPVSTGDQTFTTTPFGQGAIGATGPAGLGAGPGATGSTGPRGPAGPAGSVGAAGRSAHVSCSGTLKKTTVTVFCALTLTLPARDTAMITLSRAGRTYAHARVQTGAGGARTIRLRLARQARPGRYRVLVKLRSHAGIDSTERWTVTL